ncbi:MAG: glucose-1-phosphate thymidylyltransferase [Planctomycetia bacterium]|nr:glucose-1-phosphate thymidylyltransferase [Planctomycetia bacterium]
MTIVLFEDDKVAQLYPISVGRPAAAISCAGFTLIELLRSFGEQPSFLLRSHLQATALADGLISESPADGQPLRATANEPLVLVNARLVPSVAVVEAVLKLARAGKPGLVVSGDSIALAVLAADAPPLPRDAQPPHIAEYLGRLPKAPLEAELPLFHFPHDVVRHNLTALNDNLAYRLRKGNYREVADGVFAADEAKLGSYCVTETDKGPILLDAGASVGPYCFLRGPVYLGPSARLTEQSALKDCVSLGHTTKIGGEVEGSVIEPYTNKQHHGFLGHSYLGSWVNLGAGTCNSDLKNTYGQVNMDYHGRKVPTGMQFLGAIVGDYAKTAINTGIFTGKTVGACSMVYGFVTTNVPSFVNYARSFGQVTEVPVDILVAAQARMFARRKVEQRLCDLQLLHDMYELTKHERQMAGEPLSL